MKKIHALLFIGYGLLLLIAIPVFAQQIKNSPPIQGDNLYPCEDNLIEVMFSQASQVRLRNGNLVDLSTDALSGLDQVLSDLATKTWHRLCDVSEESLDQWAEDGTNNSGQPVFNLNNIYRLEIPGGIDIWELCRKLENLKGIELARPVPLPVEPPLPPNYQSQQGYLNPASSTPTGIDASYAWTQTGGTGLGVTVCDLEYSWNYNHGDISKGAGSSLNTWTDPGWGNDHGTAVIGELVSDNNGWGTTGICYGSSLKTCGTYYGTPTSWNVAGAIALAIANLNAGDIILLEQQWDYSPTSAGLYVPIEWWYSTSPNPQVNNPVYVAIVNAISNGIHVVEAGGNGNVNTDGMTWYGNSGAIIVGAGGASAGNDLQRLSFSSYGQRFNLQGWGENVFTTGYGYYYNAEGVNYYYTSTFNGTSSASPIVAGALACAEGYYLANVSSTPPTPAYMRTHLATYGTAQVFGTTGNIGPRPDLSSAINNFPVLQNYDWGDAIDPPYPTLMASNGASHLISGGIMLGISVDPENDGQPNFGATGDDNDGNDDEDGVIFNNILRPGSTISVTVTASVPCILNAWIDFNGFNLWADAGEYIFMNVGLVSGPNNLNFTVPPYALLGTTYARFRVSSQPGILFYGQAPDGEVEDYMVFIDEPIPDEMDWGDAPDGPYPTFAANNGANHFIDGITYLGNQIDAEPDGQPDAAAMGDDLDIIYPPPIDDEDGVIFTSPIVPGQLATVDVIASAQGFLNAWYDVDHNGSWANPGEHVFVDIPMIAGLNNLSFFVQPGAIPGPSFARFRFDSNGGLNFDGSAPNGEVEDYEIFIDEGQLDEFDWGDAPDFPYPTLSGNNGANHFIDGITYMGNMVDGEPDGQPDAIAQGDDQDIIYPPPKDDEDGVTFTSQITQGQNATVDVIVSVPGMLNAWIDFNANGSWADPGDQIFIDQFLNPGLNNLIFSVPLGSSPGNTFARFRFSNAAGLNYDGPAPDGEVEDYQVSISLGTSDIQVDPDPNHSFVQNEISMALIPGVNPGVPAVLLAAYNDHPYPGGPGLGVSYSNDGGTTWNPLQLPYPLNPGGIQYVDMFDPTATADGSGNLYVAHISTDYDWANGPESGLYVHKSTDGGISWNAPVTIAYDGKPSGSPDPNYRFNDRCQMTCDVHPTSPYYNNLYIVEIKDRGWNNPLLQSDIYFSSSTDGGATWSPQTILNGSQSNMANMPVPAVASNGTIYVCWMDYNVQTGGTGTLFLDVSSDGGVTWLSADILVATINLPPLNLNGGTDVLAKGAAVIDVSPINPQEVYITFAEQIAGSIDEGDIFFIKSTDGGITWTVPLLVNDDGTSNDQVMPWMDVKPNGMIDIVWYDRRNDPADLNWDVYMATSTNNGNSFNMNVQVNSVSAPSPNTPSGIWMGEYLGLVVDQTHAYITFTSSALDMNGDVFFNKLANPVIDIDFGDADDPTFPTLLINDGARHMLDGLTFLGASVDPESDGQPDGTATGDDNDGNNDDDGVTFNQILTGGPAQVTVTTSVAGFLQGWMDFNADGDWADPGEQIFTDEYIHFGNTVCLNYIVPVNANVGTSSARFRFSSVTGLSYSGMAPDGEVEDYEVEIIENPEIKWIQEPCEELPGLHCHDYILPPNYYDYIILADDWLCNGGLVTDIHWWGNYEVDANGQEMRGSGINHFHLSIHANDPAVCLPVNPEIWGVDVVFSTTNETNTGLINSENGFIYEYEYILDIPFDQEQGMTYWLDITAYANNPNAPAIWRWQESDRSTVPILCPSAEMTTFYPWQSIIWTSIQPYRFSDMAFIITSEEIVEEFDYGDANDPPYPTLAGSNGASHVIDGVTFLGASVDPDPDGQPDPNALGDDNDGNDDEDGVTFDWPLAAGNPCKVTVNASVSNGLFSGWIDFNGNGSWADPGEQVFADIPLITGNNSLNFIVPAGTSAGFVTYARFRFSTQPGLAYNGPAQDGEVEDYEVEITEYENYKWAQYPDINYPGLHAHDWINAGGGIQQLILADDWLCSGGLVTDIHWWGNYELDPTGQEIRGMGISHFHLSIHANSAVACLPTDPEIWGVNVPFSALMETNTGMVNIENCPIYLYEYILDIPFEQDSGTRYWLDIAAFSIDPNQPPHWRWQESMRSYFPILCGAADKIIPTPGIWNTITWANNQFSDMAFIITSEEIVEEFDYGDANDPPYPTLAGSNGASHVIDGVTFLGASVDPDPDGQPDPNALGDDNDGNDDEDGVTVVFPLYPGGAGVFNVVASAQGYLNVWIDYSANGSWTEADEHVFIDEALSAGSTWLVFTVPTTALIGKTYARFRFSTSTGLSFTGLAPDGEVEDYEMTIEGDVDVYLKVFLEGPFTGTNMTTILNGYGVIPNNQPYNSDPSAIWYYTGTEAVSFIPNNNINDWVVVEFRDAPSAPLATGATIVNKQAAFLLSDGSIVGLDGTSPLKVNGIFTNNLYAVIWHRNHLGILSANPLILSGINQYSYDFTTGPGQAYLSGQKDLGGGIYGMIGGDGQPDGNILGSDIANVWWNEAGTNGYLMGDFNMDTQVDNNDKNDIWFPNNGAGTQVP